MSVVLLRHLSHFPLVSDIALQLQLFELQTGAVLFSPIILHERIFVLSLCYIYACNVFASTLLVSSFS